MRRPMRRLFCAAFAVLFLLSGSIAGTYAWQSLSQQARNDLQSEITVQKDVELLKLEKLPDGTETTTPIPGAAFYLFTADGQQLGGLYYTDENGKIPVQLPPGEYYFEEVNPGPSHTFDTDAEGQRITRYPFTITGTETEIVQVVAYNVPLQGTLTLQKTVQNADGTELTEEQRQQAFTFTVVFSDGGTYTYRIDGGEPQELKSGGTLTLKHGQTAVFEDLPVGVTYTITETPVPGYAVTSSGHRGNITVEGNMASFTNTYTPQPEQMGDLAIAKEVKNADGSELTEEQKQQAFTFTVVFSDGGTYTYRIDGGEPQELKSGGTLTLKHGQTAVFEDLTAGVTYTVTETGEEGYEAPVLSYEGAVIDGETILLPFVNVHQPPEEPGNLEIAKEVVNADGSELTEEQKEQEFTFTVVFSDGGTYTYRIDGGEPQELASGGTLTLKHGQTAVFEDLPAGVTYTVTETEHGEYLPEWDEVSGVIVGGETASALFRNHLPEDEETAKIVVTKQLAGEYPAEEEDKEFHFTIIINGEEQEFTLKPGESMEFEVPPGTEYEIREDDYSGDGYFQTIENGSGVIITGVVESVVTNTYVAPPEIEIPGEKTWELGGYDESVLPESILVQLKQGDLVVEEAVVTPDENGQWHYTFTAPKYDADGKEIEYTIEEVPIEGFLPSYDGFDILNTYIPPIEMDPPIVEKVVQGENAPDTEFSFLLRGEEGAPMPEGSDGNTKVVTITGSGEVELGKICFTKPGEYIYTISELNTGEEGWAYDNAIYTLTVTVTEQDGELHASYDLTKEGEAMDTALFTNRYEPEISEKVEIGGTKTWNHGSNPEENWPESIIVYVYADGELVAQRQVTAGDNWQYHFEGLPRYGEDGHEIVYTIREEPVPGYVTVITGYDIANNYTGTPPKPTPEPGETPTPPAPSEAPDEPGDAAQTGDPGQPILWFVLGGASLVGILVLLLLKRELGRYRGKHER